MKLINDMDKEFPRFLVGLSITVFVVLIAIHQFGWVDVRHPFKGMDSGTRSTLYGSVASSAGALLGFVIASVTILLTLDPSRKLVKELRQARSWPLLLGCLMWSAAYLGAAMVLSTVGLAVDTGDKHHWAFEALATYVTATAAVLLLTAGCGLALLVGVLNKHDHDS